MKIGSPSLTYKGKEYVTQREFAKRVGANESTISRYIRDGKLQTVTLNGYRANYLNWEVQKTQYQFIKDIRPLVSKSNAVVSIKGIKEEGISEPKIEGVNAPNITTEDYSSKIDLRKCNPKDYPECWILDSRGNPIRHPITGEYQLNYDMLKQLLVTEKYRLDIDEKRGKYIDKDTLMMQILTISKIVQSSLDAIPQRYAETLIAMVSQMKGISFTDVEKAQLREVLKNEANNIMRSISNLIGDLAKEEPQIEEEKDTKSQKIRKETTKKPPKTVKRLGGKKNLDNEQ